MAVEIHRSGALDEAVAEALEAAEDVELQVGDEFEVSGTLVVTYVGSDPDGSQHVQTEWVEATASAPALPTQP